MNKNRFLFFSALFIILALVIAGCAVPGTAGEDAMQDDAMEEEAAAEEEAMEEDAAMEESTVVEFTLVTGSSDGMLVYFGQGGEINGEVNPTLSASVGDIVRITLINGDNLRHDIYLPDFEVQSDLTTTVDEQAVVEFTVSETGEFVYYCTTPGHREAGMEGMFVVE